MFAVVTIGGFQEIVKEGDTLEVPRVASSDGKTLKIEQVLLVSNGEKLSIGAPLVSGISIPATIIEHTRGDKIRVVKAHKRKRYRRVHGHRQPMMKITIGKIAL